MAKRKVVVIRNKEERQQIEALLVESINLETTGVMSEAYTNCIMPLNTGLITLSECFIRLSEYYTNLEFVKAVLEAKRLADKATDLELKTY